MEASSGWGETGRGAGQEPQLVFCGQNRLLLIPADQVPPVPPEDPGAGAGRNQPTPGERDLLDGSQRQQRTESPRRGETPEGERQRLSETPQRGEVRMESYRHRGGDRGREQRDLSGGEGGGEAPSGQAPSSAGTEVLASTPQANQYLLTTQSKLARG